MTSFPSGGAPTRSDPNSPAKVKDARVASKQRQAASTKYTHLERVIIIPPQLVGPRPISFFQKFKQSLFKHTKNETRREWKNRPHFRDQKRSLDEHLFVRAWCGRQGTLVGYIIYHSFTQQKLGNMTRQDVVAEGGGDLTVEQFRHENFRGLTDDKLLWVVRFTFIPLHQVVN